MARQLMSAAAATGLSSDLDLTRDALASSPLNHGLLIQGDRWTVAVLLGAFTSVTRFGDWQTRLGIPRQTLANRLRALVHQGLMRQRIYQERPRRLDYRLTRSGLKLYNHVLMIWVWERRWGTRHTPLPEQLRHAVCGHDFVPTLVCSACGEKVVMDDLQVTLAVNPALLAQPPNTSRTARLAAADTSRMALGLRVDRWSLLILTAVMLGCHHFDQLRHVLGISDSVLSRRLAGMVESSLLSSQPDRGDARRTFYRLTPASRDLLPYLLCFSAWAAREYLGQPSSIQPVHKTCGQPLQPQVVCSACAAPVNPWDVSFASSGH